MDFITAPLILGIICACIYGLFELFVRRNERMAIIEKIGDKLDASAFERKLGLPSYAGRFSFSGLKLGCLLMGLGLGLMVGFAINADLLSNGMFDYQDHWFRDEMVGVAYGAAVLLFGGLGLVIAFFLERKLGKKDQ